jgi:hypothetical protein
MFRKMLTTSALLMAAAFSFAQPVSSTEDWERREIFVDESDLQNIKSTLEQGSWSNDGFSGDLKFLLSEESSGANKLYVQWVNNEDGEVAYTVSVREFNILPEYQLKELECLSDDCNLTKIEATHVYEEVDQTFVLNLVGLGRYSVGLFRQ